MPTKIRGKPHPLFHEKLLPQIWPHRTSIHSLPTLLPFLTYSYSFRSHQCPDGLSVSLTSPDESQVEDWGVQLSMCISNWISYL